MADQNTQETTSDDLLLRRVGYGLLWGMAAAGLLGFVLLSVLVPDESFNSKLGLAAYLAFWSGPLIGLSGAVGYHELKKDHAASTANEGSRSPDRSKDDAAMQLGQAAA